MRAVDPTARIHEHERYAAAGDEVACGEIAEQDGDRGLAGQLRRLVPILADPRYVDVRNEIVGAGASEHEYLDRAVDLGSLNQRDEIAD